MIRSYLFLPLREISFKQGTNKTVSKGYHYFTVMMISHNKCHSKCSDFLHNQPKSLMCTPKRDDKLPHNLYLRFLLTLMMTSAQVVEMSVTVTNNSPFQDYPHPDDHTTRSTEIPRLSAGSRKYHNLMEYAKTYWATIL